MFAVEYERIRSTLAGVGFNVDVIGDVGVGLQLDCELARLVVNFIFTDVVERERRCNHVNFSALFHF